MWKQEVIRVFALVVALIIGPALAAEKSVDSGNPYDNSRKTAKETAKPKAENTAKISAEDCARLIEHRPRDDVAYKPGVDVDGKPVTPADTSSAYRNLGNLSNVEFDIAFSPLKGAAAGRFGETSMSAGRIAYDINTGNMTFNGRPLNDPDKALIAKRCREKLRQNR
jgi:hypothetical protein